jgi:hypothetical protein
MLTVQTVLPEGPASHLLHPGDILLAISGKPVNSFVQLETLLDDHVGQTLSFTVLRDRRELQVAVPVADLHVITPHRFLEVGGCILHDLSFHMALDAHLPVKGVYVANAVGRPSLAIFFPL